MKPVEMEFSAPKAIEFHFLKQTDPFQDYWHLKSRS